MVCAYNDPGTYFFFKSDKCIPHWLPNNFGQSRKKIPSGKHTKNDGKSPPFYSWENSHYFDWAIFNSYVDITRGYQPLQISGGLGTRSSQRGRRFDEGQKRLRG